jgi:hypothetical protein
MSLNKSLIEGLRQAGGRWTGRCPACAQAGQDRSKQHLVLFADGKYACVVNPGAAGKYHRQQIFNLVGIKEGKQHNPTPFDMSLL